MASEETRQRVKVLLAQTLGDEALAPTISDQADIINELGLDSIQLLRFMLNVEDEFDLELDFDSLDLPQLQSVQIFCDFISQEKSSLGG